MTAPLKLVRVMWEDASVVDTDTWVDRATMPPATPMVFDSVGWLIELTPEHVVLSDCVGAQHIGPRLRLPLGMVKQIVEFHVDSGHPVRLPRRKGAPR